MASNPRKTPPGDSLETAFEPVLALSGAWAANLMQLHQLQLEAWLSWQKSVAAGTQALYDEWASRFAGGVPIDG